MDPVTAIALGSAVAGGALQGVSSIMAGQEQEVAHKFEAKQLQAQARQFQTAAAQAEAARREDLSSTLQSLMAIRAGRGVSVSSSPTAEAIYSQAVDLEERNIATERLNFLQASDSARMSAGLPRRRARSSLLGGYIGAGEAFAGAAYKAASPYLKTKVS